MRLVLIQDNRVGIYEGARQLAAFVDDDWTTCTDAEAVEVIRTMPLVDIPPFKGNP